MSILENNDFTFPEKQGTKVQAKTIMLAMLPEICLYCEKMASMPLKFQNTEKNTNKRRTGDGYYTHYELKDCLTDFMW